MPEDAEPDRLLVCRLRAGDEDAFADLVEKYRAAMLSIALSCVPSLATHRAVSNPDQPGHQRWHEGAPQRTSG